MKKTPFLEKNLRSLLVFLIFFFVTILAAVAPQNFSWAAEFPSREIKLMVTHAPGGGVDIVARIFADQVKDILGVPVVVMNNATGGGTVGTLNVAQSKPDGYTLLNAPTGSIITKPIMTPEIPYRRTDFIPICKTVVMPVAVFVRNEAPWKTLKDLVEYAKKNPGKVRAISGQAGGFDHTLTSLLMAEAGIDIAQIPSGQREGGGAAKVAELLGGHGEMYTDPLTPGISYVQAGRLRALVSTHKVPGFPMIKTFEEEGYPGVSLKMWHGVFVPKGTPGPVVTKLTKAYEKASNNPSLKEQLLKQYIISDYQGPEETAKLIENEYEITLKVLKRAGLAK